VGQRLEPPTQDMFQLTPVVSLCDFGGPHKGLGGGDNRGESRVSGWPCSLKYRVTMRLASSSGVTLQSPISLTSHRENSVLSSAHLQDPMGLRPKAKAPNGMICGL